MGFDAASYAIGRKNGGGSPTVSFTEYLQWTEWDKSVIGTTSLGNGKLTFALYGYTFVANTPVYAFHYKSLSGAEQVVIATETNLEASGSSKGSRYYPGSNSYSGTKSNMSYSSLYELYYNAMGAQSTSSWGDYTLTSPYFDALESGLAALRRYIDSKKA